MGVSVRMVRAAAPTTPGVQSFEVAGFGTPKAAMFIVSGATANDSAALGAVISVGITDGVRQFCIAGSSENLTASELANTTRRTSNAKCIVLFAANGTVDAEANFVVGNPWTANGVQIDWTNAPAAAVLVTVILFTGTDLTARVGDFLGSLTIGTDIVVTVPDVPFQPDQLIVLRSAITYGSGTTSFMHVGFADRGGPIVQCCSAWRGLNGSTASEGSNVVSNAFVSETGLGTQAIEITAFSATGFTAKTRLSGGSVPYPYLALAYNGVAAHSVFVANSPAATGNQIQATTFKPQFVLQLPTGVTALSNATTQNSQITSNGGAGSWGIAGFTAFETFSNSISDDDGDQNMITRSYSANKFSCRADASPYDLHVATFVSFNPTNYTLNYTVADTTVRFWATLVIGETPTPPVAGPVPVIQNSYRQRRVW
jgi:hypothetical protein